MADQATASSSPAAPDGPSGVVWQIAERAVTPWLSNRADQSRAPRSSASMVTSGMRPSRTGTAFSPTRPVGRPASSLAT